MDFELLETMRWTPEEGWYLLDRHLARLRASARHFGFACSDQDIGAAISAAVEGLKSPTRARLLVARSGMARVEATPLDPALSPVKVRLAARPVDSTDVFLYHKTTNRAVYDQARRPDCDDVVLWNESDEATESTIANLVVEIDGRRVTPPVACGLLPGTERAERLATGEIVEARVKADSLKSASRLWLINSVRGWREAVLL